MPNYGSRRSGLCLPSCVSSLLSATRRASSPRYTKKGPVWGPLQLRLASLNAVHLGSDLVVPVLPRGRAVLLGGCRGKRGAIVGAQVSNVGGDSLAPAAKATPTTAAGTPAPGVIGAGAIEAPCCSRCRRWRGTNGDRRRYSRRRRQSYSPGLPWGNRRGSCRCGSSTR